MSTTPLPFLKKYLFIWLCLAFVVAYRIFSVGIWTLSSSMWDLVPWPGIEPSPLYWECQVLATGPPGKSQAPLLLNNLRIKTKNNELIFYPANACPRVSANPQLLWARLQMLSCLRKWECNFLCLGPISLPTVPCTEAHNTYKFKVFPPTLGAASGPRLFLWQ